MKKLFLLLLGGVLTTMTFAQKNLQVKTANGTVEGTQETSGIRSYKGIPYAAPPVGELRWKQPQPVKNWKGVLETKKFGPRAMQAPIFSDMQFRSNGVSEDCLYLNVWTPAKSSNEKLPVLVYFYGGGFVAGDGSEYRYDGENMAKKGIVTLTVNYRLGLFGFFAHPELSKESGYNASGNYGMLDQSAALKWVQQNIAAFGGDPKKVTIAGESAGSVSVSAQMASPLSKNNIAGAIGESGSLLGTLRALPLEAAEKNGVEFATKIGANSLADLRKMNADSLLNASMKYGAFRFSLNVDGYFFPKNPYEIFEAGEQAKVPLMAGWNSEESGPGAILGREKPTKENFEKAVKRLYPDKADEVLAVYAVKTDEEVEQAATDLAGDRFIGYSTWKWIDAHSKSSGQPTYRYYYAQPRPGAKGAAHSAEIEYAMNNLELNKVFAWTEDDKKVSKVLHEYFANFIKTGNPNGPGVPEWPAIKGSTVPVMIITPDPKVENEKNRERFLFMDKNAAR
jgi:para-nitrobenzyl esterase